MLQLELQLLLEQEETLNIKFNSHEKMILEMMLVSLQKI
jgi:hypothetical protein